MAKIFELLDQPILDLSQVASGHTLKHLAAALSTYWMLRMLRLRAPARFLRFPRKIRKNPLDLVSEPCLSWPRKETEVPRGMGDRKIGKITKQSQEALCYQQKFSTEAKSHRIQR